MNGGLVQLEYVMDLGPLINNIRWTKLKIYMKILFALEIDIDVSIF
jgi:hypothetical protein